MPARRRPLNRSSAKSRCAKRACEQRPRAPGSSRPVRWRDAPAHRRRGCWGPSHWLVPSTSQCPISARLGIGLWRLSITQIASATAAMQPRPAATASGATSPFISLMNRKLQPQKLEASRRWPSTKPRLGEEGGMLSRSWLRRTAPALRAQASRLGLRGIFAWPGSHRRCTCLGGRASLPAALHSHVVSFRTCSRR